MIQHTIAATSDFLYRDFVSSQIVYQIKLSAIN